MKPVVMVLVLAASAFAQSGADVYAKSCRSCHGPNGEGNAAIAKALKVELRHLGSKEVQAKSDAELKKESTEGVGKMKPVKLTDQQATDVVKHIRTFKQ